MLMFRLLDRAANIAASGWQSQILSALVGSTFPTARTPVLPEWRLCLPNHF